MSPSPAGTGHFPTAQLLKPSVYRRNMGRSLDRKPNTRGTIFLARKNGGICGARIYFRDERFAFENWDIEQFTHFALVWDFG